MDDQWRRAGKKAGMEFARSDSAMTMSVLDERIVDLESFKEIPYGKLIRTEKT